MVGHLPDPATPFIGRKRELVQLRKLLGESRILTLVGPGGVGKTRLALALAADRSRAFADGVWYLNLDGLSDADLFAATVVDVLGLRGETASPSWASLAASLRGRQALLVLDNCEHLAGPAAELMTAVAAGCPRMRLLATSRRPMQVPGVRDVPVPPLSMPIGPGGTGVAELAGSDAIRFFTEHAKQVSPTFEFSAENADAIIDLVSGLDCLPLALELAAVQLRSSTIEQVLERVTSPEVWLDWPSGADAVRQQTMRASLLWSADLCSPDERSLWAILSVFSGSFDVEAVEWVCVGLDLGGDPVDVLQGLVEKSIVVREDHGHTVRFSMLGVLRRFGHEMLAREPLVEREVADRVVRYYLALPIRAEFEWNSARQVLWLRQLPLDHRNLVSALGRAAQEPATYAMDAGRAVVALWRFYWWACGWETEGVLWTQRFVDLVPDQDIRAELALIGSLLAFTLGDGDAARTLLTVGEESAAKTQSPLALGLVEHVRGDDAMYDRRFEDALEHFRNALGQYGNSCPAFTIDTSLMLIHACAGMGDIQSAEQAHQRILRDVAPEERFHRSYAWLYLAEVLAGVGRGHDAREAIRAAVRLKAELADPFGLAWALEVAARIELELDNAVTAAALTGAAGRLWHEMGMQAETLQRLQIRDPNTMASLRRQLGDADVDAAVASGEGASDAEALMIAVGASRGPARSAPPRGGLTRRESQVAELVAEGLTNKQIAERLVIAQRTADAHVQNVLMKLGFTSRAQIASWVTAR